MENEETAFSVFHGNLPKKKVSSIQVLYDYEKHYLELIKEHSEEIEFIEDLLHRFREEQKTFFQECLPDISRKLDEESIDTDMKREWLKRLESNMDRSFSLSEMLITEYTTKKLSEFKLAVNEKLQEM